MSKRDEVSLLARRAGSGDLEAARALVRLLEKQRGIVPGPIPEGVLMDAVDRGVPVTGQARILLDDLLGRDGYQIDRFVEHLAEDVLDGASFLEQPQWKAVGVDGSGRVIVEVTGKVNPGTVHEVLVREAILASSAEHKRWIGRDAAASRLVLEDPEDGIQHVVDLTEDVLVHVLPVDAVMNATDDGEALVVGWPVLVTERPAGFHEGADRSAVAALDALFLWPQERSPSAWRAYLMADRLYSGRPLGPEEVGWSRISPPGPVVERDYDL